MTTTLTPRQAHRRAYLIAMTQGSVLATLFALGVALVHHQDKDLAPLAHWMDYLVLWCLAVTLTLQVAALMVGQSQHVKARAHRAWVWLVMKHRARWRRPDKDLLAGITADVDKIVIDAHGTQEDIQQYALGLLHGTGPLGYAYASHAIQAAAAAQQRREKLREERTPLLADVKVALLPMWPDTWAPFLPHSTGHAANLDLIRAHVVREDTTHVAIYETKPTGAIVALAEVLEVTNGYREAGVSLGRIVHLDRDLLLPVQAIGVKRPPQSVQYLTPEQVVALDDMTGCRIPLPSPTTEKGKS